MKALQPGCSSSNSPEAGVFQTIAAVALELLRAYAPARPVRLLGVRVASFADEADTPAALLAPVQLALPF